LSLKDNISFDEKTKTNKKEKTKTNKKERFPMRGPHRKSQLDKMKIKKKIS